MKSIRQSWQVLALAVAASAFGLGRLAAAPDDAALPWFASADDAKAQAAKSGKDLFILFTGSDWCKYCKLLEAEVLATPEFVRAIAEEYVFLFVDFPKSKEAKAEILDPKANQALKARYGVGGYPTVILATPNGAPYGRTGYRPGGPGGYLEGLASLKKDGAKVKALLGNEDESRSPELLAGAIPLLAQQSLLGYPEYKPFLEQVRKVDPNGERGLLPCVLAHEETVAFEQAVTQMPPASFDVDKLSALIRRSPHARGEMFIGFTLECANRLKKAGRFADAKPLFERLLGDPDVKADGKVRARIASAIAECEAGSTPAPGAPTEPAKPGS